LAFDGQAVSAPPSELRARIVSAIVLAPVALAAMLLGGVPFALLVTLVAAIAFWEWTGISGAVEPLWLRVGCALCLAAGLLALALARTDWAIVLIGAPALLTLLAGYRDRRFRWTGLGIVYVAIPCAAFIVLRHAEPNGWAAILYVVIVVWATDIAAYFGGRALGGPKLWPRVSPKKTWSGALSGLAAAIVAGGLAAWLTVPGAVVTGLVLAAPLSAASQAGDLLESALKRRFGVKDSGRIIPGHGGVLDRMDGLFAAAALAWLIAGLGLGGALLAPPGDIAILSEGAA
jgi:phosphatidate cytidylyltransferase